MTVYFIGLYDSLYDGNLIALEPLEAESFDEALSEAIGFFIDGGEMPDGVAQVVALEDLPVAATALL